MMRLSEFLIPQKKVQEPYWKARQREIVASMARYEAEKKAWARANPGCTPAEYTKAMREIANRCGV